MLTKIERLETEAAKEESGVHHFQALVRALGDPTQYFYTGKYRDTGKGNNENCACGHPIRYVFYIRHKKTKKGAKIGSVCISHFAKVNPEAVVEMEKDFKKLMKKLAIEKKKGARAKRIAKMAPEKKSAHKLATQYVRNYDRKSKKDDIYLGKRLWKFRYNDRIKFSKKGWVPYPKQYKRVADFIKWYKKFIVDSKKMILVLKKKKVKK